VTVGHTRIGNLMDMLRRLISCRIIIIIVIRRRFMGQHGSDRSRDLANLTFDLGGLWLMRVVVLHPYTKFELRKPCHLEDMVRDVYQH